VERVWKKMNSDFVLRLEEPFDEIFDEIVEDFVKFELLTN